MSHTTFQSWECMAVDWCSSTIEGDRVGLQVAQDKIGMSNGQMSRSTDPDGKRDLEIAGRAAYSIGHHGDTSCLYSRWYIL